MRLVGVAVPGRGRGPVNLALPVKVADQSLHPLHPGEPLRSQPHLCGEPPPQGSRRSPTQAGPRRPGTPGTARERRRSPPGRVGDTESSATRTPSITESASSGVRASSSRSCIGTRRTAPQLLQRHHVIPHQVYRWPGEAASRRERECHRNVSVTCFEFDHRRVASRPRDHGAGYPVDLPVSPTERNSSRFRLTHRPVPGPGKIFSTDVQGCWPARYVIAVMSLSIGGTRAADDDRHGAPP